MTWEFDVIVPTIRDLVVQVAVKIVLEAVFEDSAYGYRPRRSTIDAVKEMRGFPLVRLCRTAA